MRARTAAMINRPPIRIAHCEGSGTEVTSQVPTPVYCVPTVAAPHVVYADAKLTAPELVSTFGRSTVLPIYTDRKPLNGLINGSPTNPAVSAKL